jgi:hypothetical protein
MGTSSAFGLLILPQSYTLGEDTYVVGAAGLIELDRGSDAVHWRNPAITGSGQPILHDGRLLVDNGSLTMLDPADGHTIGEMRQPHGIYTVDVGGRVAGIGPDEIAVLEIR